MSRRTHKWLIPGVLGRATAPPGNQFVTATDTNGAVLQITAVNTNGNPENVWARYP